MATNFKDGLDEFRPITHIPSSEELEERDRGLSLTEALSSAVTMRPAVEAIYATAEVLDLDPTTVFEHMIVGWNEASEGVHRERETEPAAA